MTTQLSIVIPVYNEARNLKPLVSTIKESLDPASLQYEVLFVDDGSTDDSAACLQKIHQHDSRFKMICLNKNFGKSEAYMAGFKLASGSLVATMDGDLQDDPADLLQLIEEVHRGSDLAIGWKKTGKSSKGTFLLSKLFNKCIRSLVKSPLHDLNCPLRVMTQDVAKRLYIYSSLHRYIPILVASLGYRINEVEVSNHKRLHGVSRYGYSKYLESFFDLMTVLFVTYFRKRPLQFLGPIGLIAFLIGFTIDGYYCFLGLTGIERMRNNIPSLVLGLTLIMIGVQIVLTGLIGEMLSREIGAMNPQSQTSIKSTIGLEI
ncbi:MAG: glycosyltransferase family 2 protein [SAR324 cluster bacterium]|nr:glycosyltransferase family 2 protein [SAR324 cluster bacterium]